jgi:hypothetical protein
MQTIVIDEAALVAQSVASRLAAATFISDPLFSAAESYEQSFRDSAKKRHGAVIEAAFRDAFRNREGIEIFKEQHTEFGREFDAIIYIKETKMMIGVDVKRGISYHDSGKKREMRSGLAEMEHKLQEVAASYGVDVSGGVLYRYYHHYSDEATSHVAPISAKELHAMTGVNVKPYIDKATLVYSNEIRRAVAQKTKEGMMQ